MRSLENRDQDLPDSKSELDQAALRINRTNGEAQPELLPSDADVTVPVRPARSSQLNRNCFAQAAALRPRWFNACAGIVLALCYGLAGCEDNDPEFQTGVSRSDDVQSVAPRRVKPVTPPAPIVGRNLLVSPDGTTLAFGAEDGTIQLTETQTGNVVQEFPGNGHKVTSMNFGGLGSLIAGSEDGMVRICGMKSADGLDEHERLKLLNETLELRAHEGPVTAVALHPTNQGVATAGGDGSIRIWQLPVKPPATLSGHEGPINAVAVSPGGKLFATAGADRRVLIWDSETEELHRTLEPHDEEVTAIAFDQGGSLVAAGDAAGVVSVWNLASESADTSPTRLSAHAGRVVGLGSSASSNEWFTAGGDGKLRIWSGESNEAAIKDNPDTESNWPWTEKTTVAAHEGAITGMVAAADGATAVTCGADASIKVWDSQGLLIRILEGYQGSLRVAVSPDGSLLATAVEESEGSAKVDIWNLTQGNRQQTIESATRVVALDFSADAQLLAVAAEDQQLRIYATVDATLLETIACTAEVHCVAFSHSAGTIITAESGDSVRLYRRALVQSFAGHGGTVTDLVYAHDGGSLFSCGVDATVREWDIQDGTARRLFTGAVAPLTAMALDPAGARLVAGSSGHSAYVWKLQDLGTQQVHVALELEHGGPVRSVFLSPRGGLIATGGDDQSARIWNVAGRELERFLAHGAPVLAVGFLPDWHNHLVSYSEQGVVRTWRRPPPAGLTLTQIREAIHSFGFDPKTVARPDNATTDTQSQRESQLTQLKTQLRAAKSDKQRDAARLALSEVQASGDPASTASGSTVSARISPPEDSKGGQQSFEAHQVGTLSTNFQFDPQTLRRVRLAVSDDGKTLVAARQAAPAREGKREPGTVQAWDIPTSVQLRSWSNVEADVVQSVSLSADGQVVFTLPDMHIFELSTGRSRPFPSRATCAVSHDGATIAIGLTGKIQSTDPVIGLLDGRTFQRMPQVFEAYEAHVPALAFAANGTFIAASIRERSQHRLLLLDAETLSEHAVLEQAAHVVPWHSPGGRRGITHIASSADGETLVTHGEYDTGFHLIVWKGERKLHELVQPEPYVRHDATFGMRFVGDSLTLVTENERGIVLGDVARGQESGRVDLESVQWGCPEIILSGDGTWLASGDSRGTVALCNLSAGARPFSFTAHSGPIVGIAFSRSGEFLATAGEENIVNVWSLQEFQKKAGRSKTRGKRRRRH